jgi:transcription initiation factor IIE alpha subunit
MAGILDNEKLNITCPSCKAKFSLTVKDIKRPGAKCPKCGAKLEASQFKREIEKAERQIKDLEKSLGTLKWKS